MKKFTAILLTVIMVASLFISCDNSIAPTVTDETVSVSFTEATSRSLTASLEKFEKDKLYWKYAAKKADTTGLNSGATGSYDINGALWIYGGSADTPTDDGLGSVANFSQGIWDFMLFAYKGIPTGEGEASSTEYKLAYQGEVTGVSLKKGSANTVTVTVSPVASGTGKLELSNAISLKKADGSIYNGDALTKVYTVTALGDTSAISPDERETNVWTLDAGAYKVNVDFVKDGFTYASGSVVATVYSNITTTVSGNLAELVTKAEFDSSINPDVMNKEASSESVDLGTLTQEGASDVTLTESSGKVMATVPASAASQIIIEVAGSTDPTNKTVELALRVDTVSATNTTLELEIGMQATVTKTENNKITQTTHKVTELKDSNGASVISVVTIKLQPGLRNVCVYHNNSETPMNKLTSAEENAEGVFYNDITGVLTIKTSSFSPFTVTYDAPDFVAKIGEVGYTTLQGAVNAAKSYDKIVLIKDVYLNETVTIDKYLTINLNGYKITGNGVRALQIKQKATHIYGPGTITSNGIDVDSSVIRLGDNNASGYADLYIHEGVTVTTDTAYGITVFGNKNEYLYVYGSVISNAPENTSYDGCAISTLGTDTTESSIYIYDGAVISAANTNAIYMPSGKLTVEESDSTVITGRTGIYVKSGSTTIEGGNIIGTGPAVAYNYYGNGGISTGDALVVDSCGYPNEKPSVSITGGTFISTNANAVASYNTEGNEKVTEFITGGTFSSDPRAYLPFIYDAESDGSNWIVTLKSSSAEEPIHITNEQDWLTFAKCANTSTISGQFYVVDKDLDFTGVTQKVGLASFAGTIDFQGHKISGLNDSNTYKYRYPSLFKIVNAGATIKNLKYELPNLRTDYTVKPIGSIEGTGDVTLENIAISGNLNMTDNNTGLLVDFIGGNSKFDGTVYLIGCTSTCNMVNSGYASVFIGGIYRYDSNANDGNQIIINAKDCVNYGRIISTGQAASMLIANGTRHQGDNLTLNIENCRNEGHIVAAPRKNSNLVMPDVGSENAFYSGQEIKAFETSGAIVNDNGGITASLNAGELTVKDGNFDLKTAMNKEAAATRFELTFGFQGTGGLGAGGVTQYSFRFDSRESVVDVPAYTWVNASKASGKLTAHNEYGTTYYTDEVNHYVYNQPGYKMSNQPEVSFVAYDANGNVILVDFYSYPKK
ncbi:MAG: hypothetical protein SPF69_06855 [Candidatus Ornithospirochaeta sp.]|nr:hypothetical protein [Sphaerochaetaceae bacterium]MDY5523792.1 hypothetical protein [Candidatus Ornithospirochaeta sp.]